MLTRYLGHIDFQLDDIELRAYRVSLDYVSEWSELVFFAFNGCRFRVKFWGINFGAESLQKLAGYEGSIDTAIPQEIFDNLMAEGKNARGYVWWYPPGGSIFGQLLAIDELKNAAIQRLIDAIGYTRTEFNEKYK